jgi:hypothetical protein
MCRLKIQYYLCNAVKSCEKRAFEKNLGPFIPVFNGDKDPLVRRLKFMDSLYYGLTKTALKNMDTIFAEE